MSEKKAVIFDLDGTLLDRDRSITSFIKRQYAKFSHHFLHISEEQFQQTFISLDQRGCVWKDLVYQTMLDNYGLTSIRWEELLADYMQSFHEHCLPFDDLDTVLKKLREEGYVLGLITNGLTDFQSKNMKALGIDALMDVILISEKEGIKKPDPAIFHRALHLLDISPGQSIYVGDHPVNDIKGALDAEMKAIWKKDPGWDPTFSHDTVIEILTELPPAAEKLLKRKW
ncbi:HAD family hydrolase [Peribacillus deserti]|uniref:L-2-haloalkanoic acid dehalogenase n=1 Tax=Peribacillus deserti TaxID=673318 RepID=A0A2N5M587_9BACI|nr:HAD-IA family hydrolase [Peribacillus deserti]PLT29520.1 L-2-haloalkanoic acid dehalogenase [Peribacillus deserti]